jgi:hypothetical protein
MAAISDVFDKARSVLNDTLVVGGTIYNDAALLPFVKIANDELGDYLLTNGVTVQKQIIEDIPVLAGIKELTLPANIINPITLYEKAVGAPDADYARMNERAWEPNTPQANTLILWVWRNQKVLFNGATTDRMVRLDYNRLLADIVDEDTLVEVIGSSNFLSFRTGALGARHIGENPIKANELDLEAIRFRDNLLQIGVRKNQSIRGRRRPFRLPFMSRYY